MKVYDRRPTRLRRDPKQAPARKARALDITVALLTIPKALGYIWGVLRTWRHFFDEPHELAIYRDAVEGIFQYNPRVLNDMDFNIAFLLIFLSVVGIIFSRVRGKWISIFDLLGIVLAILLITTTSHKGMYGV